jgi:DNA-binding transcriptional MerR regulator
MEYGVEELARAAGVRVDTVRFYQARGLLPAPRRVGRRAIYSGSHLARLRRIRTLQREGLPLDVIRRVLGERRAAGALARALRAEQGSRSLTRAELASESGVPEALIRAVEQAGILEPVRTGGEVRYTEADLELARAALALLNEQLPLPELLALAIHQAESVREVVDRAIELFDRHARRDRQGRELDPGAVVEAFRRMLPAVTALVAHHFHRTLVSRALARLERLGDQDGLRHAIAATRDAGRLEVTWR